MENKAYRQGDIYLKKVDEIPADAKEIKDFVLAYGEVTGHKHQLQGKLKVRQRQEQKYIEVEEDSELVHEEHATIQLEKGNYIVIRQREYDPQRERLVSD